MDFSLETSQLNDETEFLQLGNAQQTFFYGKNEKPELIPSAWNKYPSKEDPYSKYKFTGIEIGVNPDLKQINRQTYSALDFLGDCGGLFDALLVIGQALITPF